MSDSSFTNSEQGEQGEQSEWSSESSMTEKSNSALVNVLKQEGCIIEGQFTLKNGETSNIYYDIKTIISHPVLFRNICHSLISLLPKELINYRLIFGIPYGGLPIASYLSLTNNKPLIYSRNKKKEYGTQKLVEGKYKAGQKVIIVDDVITTGGSLKEAIILARDELKLKVLACLVVVNRNNINELEGVPIFGLINAYT